MDFCNESASAIGTISYVLLFNFAAKLVSSQWLYLLCV